VPPKGSLGRVRGPKQARHPQKQAKNRPKKDPKRRGKGQIRAATPRQEASLTLRIRLFLRDQKI